MKTLLLVLVILALVITAGKLLYSEPGLLTISYPGWIVETSPVAALVVFVVVVIALMSALKLLSVLLGLFGYFRNRGQTGGRARAQRRLTKGFIEFTEGHWQRAEKLLARTDKRHETALISWLTAARAAHYQSEPERRDSYLELAAGSPQRTSTAVDITRAQFQIDQQDYESALETLAFLRSSVPRNAIVVQLLASVYRILQNWSKLDALLPVIRRYKALDAAEYALLERDCRRGMIETCEKARLTGYWQRLPKHARQSPELLSIFISRLVAEDRHGVAEKMLRERLNQDWSDELVAVYTRVKLDDEARQLDYAESWVGEHGRSAPLLLTLGELCLRCQLWGKARVYLESSLGIQASARASLVLAELLTQLGEIDNARNYYASGLRLALDQNPESFQAPAVLTAVENTDDDDEPPAIAAQGDLKLVEKQA